MVKMLYLNDEYYQLVRRISVEQVDGNMDGLKAWRDMNHCDRVLKYQGEFLLVRTVDEVEIISSESVGS
ncbi:hypothetical protein N9J42_00275 [bacterium]|jgi:hypothetical protein|nr:hypothetical protein [bacterium]